jgi:hypothetical protein
LFPNSRIVHHSSNHVIAKAMFSRLKQSPVKRGSFFDEVCLFKRRLFR